MVMSRPVVVSVAIVIISITGDSITQHTCRCCTSDRYTWIYRLALISICIVRCVATHRGNHERAY
jgi:predicted  nucleic acid-binding Zn ribbon protein